MGLGGEGRAPRSSHGIQPGAPAFIYWPSGTLQVLLQGFVLPLCKGKTWPGRGLQ